MSMNFFVMPVIAATLLSGCVRTLGQTPAPTSRLTDRVAAIAAQHHGQVAVFAENLKTHETVALSPDLPVPTASVIKLAILYEALEQIRAGKASFSDRIAVTPDDLVGGSGLLQLFDTPMSLTLKDVLTMMIVMSDNTGANLAMDKVGIANVNARMAALGLKNTYLYKKVFKPVPAGETMPEDQKRFGLGKTTAREMASLMSKLATCDLGGAVQPGDAVLCAAANKMLQHQFYRATIPRYLDGMPGATGDSIASKTGSLDAVRNDVAAISTKHGLVVIACFTFENRDHTWGYDQEGEGTIAKVAREIVTAWSPDGLAPWPK